MNYFYLIHFANVSEGGDCQHTHSHTRRLTRVEQNDSFEAHKLLGFEFERAETGGGGQQHVEDLRHSFDTVAFVPVYKEKKKPMMIGMYFFSLSFKLKCK